MKYIKLYEDFENITEKVFPGDVFYIGARAYDVGKAYDMILANPDKYKSETGYNQIELEDLSRYFDYFVKVDKDYAEKLNEEDLTDPGIFIVDGELTILIDGWHRAYALWKKGETSMNIWTITDPEDITKIKLR